MTDKATKQTEKTIASHALAAAAGAVVTAAALTLAKKENREKIKETVHTLEKKMDDAGKALKHNAAQVAKKAEEKAHEVKETMTEVKAATP